MYCGEATLVNPTIGSGRAVTLFCKCCGCRTCNPGYRKRLKALLLAGEPDMLLTLTAGPKAGDTTAQAIATLKRGWQILRRRMAKRLDLESLPFHVVVEATKKGRPHLHILCRAKFVKQAWLSNQMKALAGSPIVHVTRIWSQRHAAAYLGKYLTKVDRRFPGSHRHWGSQNYCLDAPDNPPERPATAGRWRVDRRSLRALESELKAAQYLTHPDGNTLIWCWGWPNAPPDGRLGFYVPP